MACLVWQNFGSANLDSFVWLGDDSMLTSCPKKVAYTHSSALFGWAVFGVLMTFGLVFSTSYKPSLLLCLIAPFAVAEITSISSLEVNRRLDQAIYRKQSFLRFIDKRREQKCSEICLLRAILLSGRGKNSLLIYVNHKEARQKSRDEFFFAIAIRADQVEVVPTFISDLCRVLGCENVYQTMTGFEYLRFCINGSIQDYRG